MKATALALLVPFAVCSALGQSGAQSAMAAAPPAGAETRAPAPGNAGANRPATASAPEAPRTSAQASLTAAPGSSVKGDLTLASQGTAVTIRGEITGLSPGKEHGFHIHENGQCTAPDFKSAGEHFNPTRDPHGDPDARSKHLGDMPNAKADDNGRATIDVSLAGATLEDKDGGPNQILGKAIVVHALPDDYKTQPSGGSGDRIACAVIR